MPPENVLIIRLGALGDILLCMQAFQDIRATYPKAHITFLTTPPFAAFARTMPWFDAVLEDVRPKFWQLGAWLKLGVALKKGAFTHVFDLQNKPRTALYVKLFLDPKKILWSSAAKGASHPRPAIPHKMHRQDEMRLQLAVAGVTEGGALDLDWLKGDLAALSLPEKYVVIVPGCSPHLLHKRWAPQHYATLARYFSQQGFATVAVGTKADAVSIAAIREAAPFVLDISGKTSLAQLASLYRGAHAVVGNDTGPTFLAAMVGAPTLTLMSYHTDPVLSGPRGSNCAWLKEAVIDRITVETVIADLQRLAH